MTWNKPSGRGVDFMSIFEINETIKDKVSPCDKYTDIIINGLINSGIFCSITNSRKINSNQYKRDHSYAIKVCER